MVLKRDPFRDQFWNQFWVDVQRENRFFQKATRALNHYENSGLSVLGHLGLEREAEPFGGPFWNPKWHPVQVPNLFIFVQSAVTSDIWPSQEGK